MKKLYLAVFLTFVLVITSFTSYSQSSKPGLNQVQLMKQWIGIWRTEGTNITSELKAFGSDGLEGYQMIKSKDSIASEYRFIYGFDKQTDKYISASISWNNQGILLMAFYFTSKTKCERIPIDFINNPGQSPSKAIYEFISPGEIKATFIEKNKPDRVFSIKKEK